MLELANDLGSRESRHRHCLRIHAGPVGFTRDAFLVPDPPDVRPGIGKDHRFRLERTHGPMDPGPVIHLALAVGTLAVGTVEPDLGNRSVLGQQFGELAYVEVVVPGRIAVRRLMPVPR